MRRNRRGTKRIRNLVLFIMMLIIIIGLYINIRNSRAEDLIKITAKVTDIEEKVEAQVIELSAVRSADGSYNLKLPGVINSNNVSIYYIGDKKNLKVNEDGTININLSKKEIEEQSINIKTKYDTKEIYRKGDQWLSVNNTEEDQEIVGSDEQTIQETAILYRKTLENEEGTIAVEGYMPLNSELKAVIRNLGIEETEQVLTIGEISQTQKIEISIEQVGADASVRPKELLIGEVSSTGGIGLTQEKEPEIKEYNPKDYGETLTIKAITESGAIINIVGADASVRQGLVKELEIEENTAEVLLTIANNVEDTEKIEQEIEHEEVGNLTEEEIEELEEMGIFFAGGIRYQEYEEEEELTKEIEVEETETKGGMTSAGTMTITTNANATVSYTLSHDHYIYYPSSICGACGGTGRRGTCSNCGGSGSVPCAFCGGTGNNCPVGCDHRLPYLWYLWW